MYLDQKGTQRHNRWRRQWQPSGQEARGDEIVEDTGEEQRQHDFSKWMVRSAPENMSMSANFLHVWDRYM
jgi:hypothetical protein